MKTFTATELIKEEEAMDKRCIEFIAFVADKYYANEDEFDFKNIYKLLEEFKNEKFKNAHKQ